MKIDEFDQYIRDRYQGYEVTPPPHVEAAVMGKLARTTWGRRFGGAALLLAAVAAWWAIPMNESPAEYVPALNENALPPVAPLEASPIAIETGVESTEEMTQVTTTHQTMPSVNGWHSIPQPQRLEPLSNLVGASALEVDSEVDHTIRSNANGEELWVISAEVEVKD